MASKDFLSRTMIKNSATKVETGIVSGKRVNRETLSPLDMTVYHGAGRPGQLLGKDAGAAGGSSPLGAEGFSTHVATLKPTPMQYLQKHTGLGGTISRETAVKVEQSKQAALAARSPPRAHAAASRLNPPNSELRRYYERSDLPCLIQQGARNKLAWKADIAALDYAHYLPIFASGLREVEEPYRFIAEEGVHDLIQIGGEAKVLPVIPQLILPLKEAMATRDERVLIRTLKVLQALAGLGPRVGAALVPYYRQILPVLNIFAGKSKSLGDAIDYAQRFGHLSELITLTLQKLELNGGPDAYINIKYLVPTYESAVLNV